MYKVIYYHKQNYCNVLLNSTGTNMIANVIIMFTVTQAAYTANCPSEFIKLPNYQHYH